ncbi:hypothetical protein [Salinarimonas rosea]|uniref:hypothetical protein n=1 Tax=Salinarimonas rosea TaxID=552063 RepID=UPI000406BBE5|nr:hypothetical protein [Salinarimonas rosea]
MTIGVDEATRRGRTALRLAGACATLGLLAGLAAGPAAAREAGPGFVWGDDSSRFANDGECDDPRFRGAGMAKLTVEENRGADAGDCRRLFEAGAVDPIAAPEVFQGEGIDFGDDSGRWANDGECEDPRFTGEGMAALLLDEDRMRDASDCRRLLEGGAIALRGAAPAPATGPGPATAGIDFGDDTGRWPNDGECDDPRFEGAGMAAQPFEEERLRDAGDCRRLFEGGAVALRSDDVAPGPQSADGIDFGDDTGRWPNDGECDDPRFEGAGMAAQPLEQERLRDAGDCRRLFEEGAVALRTDDVAPVPQSAEGIDFGDDTGRWPNDDECDDPRFEGAGMAGAPSAEELMRDASDCRRLFEAGLLARSSSPRWGTPAAVQPPLDAIAFGDDSGSWPKDGECDDPRFVGEGMAFSVQEETTLADASDCRRLYKAGSIALAATAADASPPPTPSDEALASIDFGADTSRFAGDGECDDPRFEGDGMAAVPLDEDRMADAGDCRALFAQGRIRLRE